MVKVPLKASGQGEEVVMYATSSDRLLLLLGAVPTVSFTLMILGNLVVTSRRGVPCGRWIRHPDDEALLLERFVRGEIDDDEYRAHREALRGQAALPKVP